jgi:hypothetical protein
MRAVWEALSEVAALAAEAASLEMLVTRQGHVLTAPDFLATLVTEATIHGLDLATALHRHPWASDGAMGITRATLVGLLGGEPPPVLAWDDVTFVLKGTGRAPVTPDELSLLASRSGRLPLLAQPDHSPGVIQSRKSSSSKTWRISIS